MGHATASTSAPPALVIAGRYRVERTLGEGGMGIVYAVVDLTSEKRLALKRLFANATASTAALFEREYHTLAGLRHPCIVEVYDYGNDAEGAFYTMELIGGRDLSKDAPKPWRDMCRDLRDVASTLGVLHARQLLHRDLSPRNLLRSDGGRLKLIDFGALASFGPNKQLVGTPPFVAPEALQREPLDQRTDLFALGALAYWLLTGAHAFAARHLNELPGFWETEPSPPSELVSMLGADLLPPVPAELDALIASLLRIAPGERLGSTGELIDRLNAIAELEPESHELAAQGYLDSKAFVGRVRERERAVALLQLAGQGSAQTLLIEGDAGVGHSRFLQELVVVSRLSGAVPIVAESALGVRPYGVAESLLFGLLRALPGQAREALGEHAALLSNISKELRTELGVSARASLVHAPAELRVRLLTTLRDVVLRLSKDRLLAVFIDDLQDIDEESQALVASLAHAEPGPKLMIVAALGRSGKREAAAALASVRSKATRLRLLTLTNEELHELLRSVFGQAQYLERLSERLHRASDGNPAYCLELAQHLVQSGQASYRDGIWSLPAELAPESLPKSRQAAHIGRLERLSDEARGLARTLSVPHATELSADQCFAVSRRPPPRVHELLAELEREGVLRSTPAGYRFAHEEVQTTLCAELPEADRKLAHLRLGEQMAASDERDELTVTHSALHFLRAGDLARGYRQLQTAGAFYERGDTSSLNRTAPLLEECYRLLQAQRQDVYGTVGVLALLAVAGYFADRKYAVRYGEPAITALDTVLKMALMRKIERFVGRKLAVIVTLVIAAVALRRRQARALTFKQLMREFVTVPACLAGTATCSLDPEGVARNAAVLEPLASLDKHGVVAMTHRFTTNLIHNLRDTPAYADAQLRETLARLDSPIPIRGLPAAVKANYIAGTLLSIGSLASWRDGPECLQIADRLEQFSPMYKMSADHLRASFYAAQGDLQRSELLRKRIEVHAVQLGSAWQVETWAPADAIKIALRANDPSLMKRTVQELGRLSSEIPSLSRYERQARGAYLVLRKKYAQAIPLLESDEAPAINLGWSRSRGVLARAYNGLGDHERAKAICLDALGYLSSEDLSYVVLNLNVQIELALAEAGLGHFDAARAQLDALLAQHAAGQGPMTLGPLHEARARVSLRERDFAAAREQLAKMESYFRATGIPTLIELIAPLKREIDRAERPQGTGADSHGVRDRVHVMTRVQLMLSRQDSPVLTERALTGLQLALELSSADEGFLVLAKSEGVPVAHLGNTTPTPDLVMWAEQSMLDAGFDDQTVMTDAVDSEVDSNYKMVDQTRYCVVPLWARRGSEDRVVAALVLGFDNRVPRLPEPSVLRAIAMHLLAS